MTIFEVGPRDGLQNEKKKISFSLRLSFIQKLILAGLKEVEIGLFVRPDRVPQMRDTDRLFEAIKNKNLRLKKARAWSLIANQKGLERALSVGARNLAVFTGVTDAFIKRNIGLSVQESLVRFKPLIEEAKKNGAIVRGYLSTAFGCPYEGKVSPKKTLRVVESLAKLGVFQVSIGDTIGVATPGGVDAVIQPALRLLGKKRVAVHFHDTRGIALANTLRSLELGVETIDSSAGGLGGCPFAPGATGNLATEDLVYMLQGMGVQTGVNLEALSRLSLEMARKMKKPLASRFLQAYAAKSAKPRRVFL